MNIQQKDKVRQAVREQYGAIAEAKVESCCAPSCCAPVPSGSAALGYSAEDLAAVPDGANLGLGCGNPQAIANLRLGETVVDLGAGAGFDCFLAARQVGEDGRVIGVYMTPAMITKARANAAKVNARNIEFRLGEIEHLPVADSSVDVILSNCVINLSPDKAAVFREAIRVLRPGGRLAISDVVMLEELPPQLADSVEALTGCVSGAATVVELERLMKAAGFVDVRIDVKPESAAFIKDWLPGSGVENYVASASIEAIAPAPSTKCCG